MRVVAGKYGGRTLKTLRGMALRPTSDRLRETLFNILGRAVEDSVFVDVYAGTGAVGIEALSRGARAVYFIERHPPAVALIANNLATLGVSTRKPAVRRGDAATVQIGSVDVEILAGDAVRGLEKLAERHMRADFVFLDPPYTETHEYNRALEFLDGSLLLAASGRIIVEHARRHDLPDLLKQLERTRVVEQGDAALSFYRLAVAA